MTCKKCGSPLAEGARFCAKCGEPRSTEYQAAASAAITTAPVQTPVAAAPVVPVKENNSPLRFIAGGAFVIIALLSLFWSIQDITYGAFHIGILLNLIDTVGCGIIAASLFMGKKHGLIPLGGLLMTLTSFVWFAYGFTWGQYLIDYSYISDEFNPFTMLPNLLYIAAFGLFAGYTAVYVFGKDESLRKRLKLLWFVPVVVYLLGKVLHQVLSNMLHSWNGASGYVSFQSVMYTVALMIGFALTGLYLSKKTQAAPAVAAWTVENGTEANGQDAYTTAQEFSLESIYSEGFIEMVKHVLLLLFTCGIWLYVWIFQTTKFLNRVKDEPVQNELTQLLLCMFVPFYYIYWVYVNSKRIDKLAAQAGMTSDIGMVCLLCAIFLPILAPIFMQDQINKTVKPVAANGAPVAPAPVAPATAAPAAQPVVEPVTAPAPVAETADAVAELKAFKELLDSGIITQEEFDAKKKDILGL